MVQKNCRFNPIKPLSLAIPSLILAACSSTPNQMTPITRTTIPASNVAINKTVVTTKSKPVVAVKSKPTPSVQIAPPLPESAALVQENAALLDIDSLDELEGLLEATDMSMVENNALLVQQYGDLWDRLRASFNMNSSYYHPRIEAQKSWFIPRQDYLNRLTARASRYLYHTVREAERRNIPTELALLPVIESSYDPVATSNAAAAGLWQFIPSTGRIYGLNQTSTYDGRRDVIESTRAAYDFLTTLYNQFGSWELALAAYNAGPGRIQSAINYNANRGLPTDYWSLRLPKETMNYVPRFLAVAQIVKNPSAYNVNLPAIANRQHFRSVPAGVGVTLNEISGLTGVSYNELRALNPALITGRVDSAGPSRVLIPNDINTTIDGQITALKSVGFNGFPSSTSYPTAITTGIIQSGENITATQQAFSQAVKNQTTTYVAPATSSEPPLSKEEQNKILAQMQSVNTLPTTSAQVTENNTIVQEPPLSKEERDFIAKQIEQTSPQVSEAVNPVDGNIKVTAIQTQQSVLDAKGATKQLSYDDGSIPQTSVESKKKSRPTGNRVDYQVKRGDTLAIIANRMGVSWRDIAEWNQIDPKKSLLVGSTLYIYNTKVKQEEVTDTQPITEEKSVTPPESYVVKSGDTLTGIARKFNLSVADLASYNNLSTTYQVRKNQTLWLIPDKVVKKAEAPKKVVKEEKAKSPKTATGRPKTYKVEAGDSLTALAQKFELSVDDLAAANKLSNQAILRIGQTLKIPAVSSNEKVSKPTDNKAEKSSSEKVAVKSPSPIVKTENLIKNGKYTVQAGDSLSSIAVRFNVSLTDLAKANKLDVDDTIKIEQKLYIPKSGSSSKSTESETKSHKEDNKEKETKKTANKKYTGQTVEYTVRAGDSLNGLASRYGISASQLAGLNHLEQNAQLIKGKSIKVPKTSTSYKIKSGDNLNNIAKRYNTTVKALAELNGISTEAKLKLGESIKVPIN